MIVAGINLARGCLPFRFDPPATRESNLEVPKLVHLIWIGGACPIKYLEQVEMLRAHNPDYVITLWDEYVTQYIPFRNRDLYDAETNMGAKADILRYEIVHRFGGIYLDVDHISLGPGSLHEDMRRSFVQVSGEPWCNTTNSDFGFAAGSEFLGYVIENLRDTRVRTNGDIPSRTGPTFFTTCVVSFGDERLVRQKGWVGLERLHHQGDHNWK